MDALTCLTTRRSIPRLTDPAPSPADVQVMLEAAVCAPDHAELRPWRFTVISGSGRARLGELFADGERGRGADAGKVEKAASNPFRAPMIIAVMCVPVQPDEAWNGKHIPPWEQLAAAAAAAQNLCLAAHALGYGSIWRTGSFAEDEAVRSALGMSDGDTLVGWVYLGTTPQGVNLPPRRPTPLAEVVTTWS